MSTRNDLALEAVDIFLTLLDRALSGDARAQRRVATILPARLRTSIVREAERRKDQAKFGSK